MLLVFIFFAFVLLWLIWGELRTKAVKVSIDMDRINVKGFLGLGISKEVFFSEIDGYKITNLPSEYRTYEYLYLIKAGKKVIKLSEFYHNNYDELKNGVSAKSKNLGVEKFSYLREFREIFT
jgi:hypothetical protein